VPRAAKKMSAWPGLLLQPWIRTAAVRSTTGSDEQLTRRDCDRLSRRESRDKSNLVAGHMLFRI